MRLRVLGPVEIGDGSGWRPVPSGRARSILAAILLSRDRLLSVEEIAFELWGDSPPRTVVNQVHGHVARLRHALGRDHGASLVTRKHGYQLMVADEDVDGYRFDVLAAAGRASLRSGAVERAANDLDRALALWHGSALADVVWTRRVETARMRFESARLAALEARIEADLACGRHAELVGELETLLAEHPFREVMWEHLILALHRSGRRADAAAAFHQAGQVLTAELGIDPGQQLCELHEKVLRSDPELDVGTTRAPVLVSPVPMMPRQLPAEPVAFTGRERELATLDRTLIDGTGPRAVTVTGPAGVGKSALAVHWAHCASAHFPDGQLFVDLAGEPVDRGGEVIARLLRDLGLPPEQVPVDLTGRTALYRTCLAGKRVLILVDDAATEVQVEPLVPGTGGSALVVTSRRRLTGLDRAHRLPLDRLTHADSVRLLTRWAEPVPSAGVQAALDEIVHRCDRLPLALRIAASRLSGRSGQSYDAVVGRIRDVDHLVELAMGGRSVAAALGRSLDQLTCAQERMLHLLAVHTRGEVDVRTAATLAGYREADAAPMLDELVDVHLLEEPEPGRYRLHALVRACATHRSCSGDRHRTEPEQDLSELPSPRRRQVGR